MVKDAATSRAFSILLLKLSEPEGNGLTETSKD